MASDPTSGDSIPPAFDLTRFLGPFPSEIEVSQVQRQITEAERSLDRFDAEARDKERDSRIRSRIQVYSTYISPIRRIPIELLTEIFSSLPNSCGLRVSFDDIDTPTLNLSHVCSSWRAVTLSTPKYWSNLDINLENGRTAMQKIVDVYLRLSGNSPLQLRLSASSETGDAVYHLDSVGYDVLGMLLDASGR
ncbi:hypothetical protein D9758_002843 [Tetrapyrgos nigripes]|uniref:F-box domain-containing protein n=1 Tax=Tetrapyrgos nigripes TaxID=182062 RepID=A0A8H5GQ68_9AGAR|nr:hypothetical protein D9758_002843 [Tetrapyrgos nigripes]